MKRREFIGRVLGIGSVVLLGVGRMAKRVVPRRFVRAVNFGRYPGGFRPPHDIFSQSKWSG
jgi:hypothetical protein